MTAIPAAERGAHQALTRRVIAAAAIRESADGFVFELPAAEYDAVALFVAKERLCCPFLTFVVTVRADERPVEMRVIGPAAAKDFIRAELHLPL